MYCPVVNVLPRSYRFLDNLLDLIAFRLSGSKDSANAASAATASDAERKAVLRRLNTQASSALTPSASIYPLDEESRSRRLKYASECLRLSGGSAVDAPLQDTIPVEDAGMEPFVYMTYDRHYGHD